MSDPNPLFEQVARERLIYNEPPTGPIPKVEFTHDDGTTYRRVGADEFPSFDFVDSRTIEDDGAPD